MSVRTVTRRGERRLVIDIVFRNPDGSLGRYRKDAEVQILAAARAEDRRRIASLATIGFPVDPPPTNERPLLQPPIPPPSHATLSPPQPSAAETTAPLFKSVVKDYLTNFAPSHLKPSTQAAYRSLLTNILVPRLGELPIDRIDAAVIRALDADLVKRKVRPTTRRQYQATIRSVLCRYAVEAGLLPAPGPRFPPLPRVGRTVLRTFTSDEVQRILKVSEGVLHRALMLAVYAGLRAGEIRGLRWRDVDLGGGQIIIRQSLCRGTAAPPKSGHERTIPLAEELQKLLTAVTGRDRNAPVAPNSRGKVWGDSGLTHAFKRLIRKAGLDLSWRLHDLRHAFVTQLFRVGVSAPTVKALAGHTELATTQRYAHVAGVDLEQAIRRLVW